MDLCLKSYITDSILFVLTMLIYIFFAYKRIMFLFLYLLFMILFLPNKNLHFIQFEMQYSKALKVVSGMF